MEPEIIKYYESLFEMYASDGWKYLMEDLREHAKHYESIKSCYSENSLFLQKGRLEQVEFLLRHEETMKAAYEEINAPV